MKKAAKKLTKKTKQILRKARKVAIDFESDYKPSVQTCSGPGPRVLTTAELEAPHLFFWKTRDGQILRISDMQLDHLLNARALLRRRIAKQSEVEEAMSREVRRRTGSVLAQYGSALDPMGKYAPAYEPDDYFDDNGQH